ASDSAAGSGLPQEGAEAVQRPGVDDVVGGEPAALGGADAVADVAVVADGVGVGVHGELHPEPPGAADQVGGQVQAVGERVDLQGGAGAGGAAEHLVPVGVDGRAAADAPGGRVPDHVDAGVLAGADEAAGHRVPVQVEVRVDRGHAHVEAGQEIGVPVDPAVRVDVQLGAVEEREVRVAGLQLGDAGALRSEEHTSELQSREKHVCRLL